MLGGLEDGPKDLTIDGVICFPQVNKAYVQGTMEFLCLLHHNYHRWYGCLSCEVELVADKGGLTDLHTTVDSAGEMLCPSRKLGCVSCEGGANQGSEGR